MQRDFRVRRLAPLGQIETIARLLLDRGDEVSDRRRWLEIQLGLTRQIEQTMHCLLELGRAQRAPLRTEDIDLSALCDRLRSDLPEGPRRGAIAWKISRGLRVRGCPAQVALLMRNLLANAAKYTRETVHPVVAISAGVHDITVVRTTASASTTRTHRACSSPSCARGSMPAS